MFFLPLYTHETNPMKKKTKLKIEKLQLELQGEKTCNRWLSTVQDEYVKSLKQIAICSEADPERANFRMKRIARTVLKSQGGIVL